VSPKATPLLRQLGIGSATALVISNMIGTGIPTTSGFLAGQLGSAKLVSDRGFRTHLGLHDRLDFVLRRILRSHRCGGAQIMASAIITIFNIVNWPWNSPHGSCSECPDVAEDSDHSHFPSLPASPSGREAGTLLHIRRCGLPSRRCSRNFS